MNLRFLVKLNAILGGVVLFALSGCDRKTVVSEKLDKEESAQTGTILKPAEPNSFEEVSARLDRGGSLYFYLSVEQWLAGLSEQIASFREVILASFPGNPNAAGIEKAEGAFNIAKNLLRKSGLEEISGVGASSFAIEQGVSRNKLFVHHYQGKNRGLIWSVFGKAPHSLIALDLLPADTVMASFADLDLAQIVGVLRQEVEQSGIPEAKMFVDQALTGFLKVAGMPIDEALQSLDNSIGLILTLDPGKMISLPVQAGAESIPLPRLALLVQVKDDRIFKQVDRALSAQPAVVRIDEPGLRMRTITTPFLPQMEIRATIAHWDRFLVLASDDKLVRDIVAVQRGGHGLKATPEFAKLVAGLPKEGNAFQLTTQRFADTWNQIQRTMVRNQPAATAQQAFLMEKLLAYQKAESSYSVSSLVENGWLVTGKGTRGASQMIAPLIIVPAAVAAGIVLPALGNVQKRAKAAKSFSQARQIGLACKLYASDHNGQFPPSLETLVPDYLPVSTIFISPFATDVPMGYNYIAGLMDTSPPATILLEDKFAPREHQRVVCHVDGSVEIAAAP